MPFSAADRLRFVRLDLAGAPDLVAAVMEGLTARPKRLPSCFFYDARGSELFEAISALPEYYLTRTEQAILEKHALDILEKAGESLALVELGSGSSRKTRLLIEALLSRQDRLLYVPIDISAEFLRESAAKLRDEYPRLWITAIAAEYRAGLDELPEKSGPRLILFLGSNIGNFDAREAREFLKDLRMRMRPEDRALIGIDRMKDRRVIEAAYNDPQGITEQFNKNILRRVNRELNADFDPALFAHHAPWVEEKSRIEMHLVSRVDHRVYVSALGRSFRFQDGESIHTENSHKYTAEGFTSLARSAGLIPAHWWSDDREWFSIVLLEPDS